MNGSEFVFDTNVFLYLQSGRTDWIRIFNESSVFISVITELELQAFNGLDSNSELELKQSLKSCFIVDLEIPIRQIAIDLRKLYNIKLPDALIAVTAMHPLVFETLGNTVKSIFYTWSRLGFMLI
jgi:predicted nucleic acid-binding protein